MTMFECWKLKDLHSKWSGKTFRGTFGNNPYLIIINDQGELIMKSKDYYICPPNSEHSSMKVHKRIKGNSWNSCLTILTSYRYLSSRLKNYMLIVADFSSQFLSQQYSRNNGILFLNCWQVN